MKRYWAIVVLMIAVFLGIFFFVEQLQISLLVDPEELMNGPSVGAALGGIALLLVDVLLPVPSSLVMIMNGALFGVALGMLLSMVGTLLAAIAGFALGRWGAPLLAKFIPEVERQRANRLLEEWGLVAMIVTRPVPLLAETTAIMAGASPMRWQPMLLAAFLGSVPITLLYALTGATAANLDNVLLSFGLTIMMAGLFWIMAQRLRPKLGTNQEQVGD